MSCYRKKGFVNEYILIFSIMVRFYQTKTKKTKKHTKYMKLRNQFQPFPIPLILNNPMANKINSH